MANKYNYLFKYIIIGDPSVGKSNLLMKFAHNKFTDEYQATIGVEFGAKNITFNNQIYRIQIWDTAGQENFRSITRAYYKNSVCAMVVYDITSRESFEHVQNWIQDIKDQSPKTVLIVLVGNKIDLVNERKVKEEEGKAFAEKHNFIFQEMSALTGDGIQELFLNKLLSQIRTHLMNKEKFNADQEEEQLKLKLQGSTEKILNSKSKKKCCCCPI